MIMMIVLSTNWNRPMWVIFMICMTIVICVLLANVDKWIWRR